MSHRWGRGLICSMAPGSTFENPLTDHPKYVTVKYLSEGSFGFVVLAKEKKTGKQVLIPSTVWYCVVTRQCQRLVI